MERVGLKDKIIRGAAIGGLALAGYGVITTHESDCESGVKINGDIYVCNTQSGVEVRHNAGEDIFLDRETVCDSSRVYIGGDEVVRAYKYGYPGISVTEIHPEEGKIKTDTYSIPGVMKNEC